MLENLSLPTDEGSQKEHDDLIEVLTNTRLKISETTEMWVEGTLSKSEFERAHKMLSEKRDEIERKLDKMEAAQPILKMLTAPDLNTSWEDRNVEEKRALLALVVKKVIIRKSKSPGRNTFDRERIEIVWREEF